MSLTLAVETSSARYGIALGDARGVRAERGEGPGETRDLGDMLSRALADLGADAQDIAQIAVDIGPGSLGSLRDGVAFANGLAYALARPVFAFTSFELIGAVAAAATGLPVLCTRRANEGLAYAGLFENRRVTFMRHGSLDAIAPQVIGAHRRLAVAGSFRALALPGVDLVDSGVETPEAATMLALGFAGRAASDPLRAPVFPLTESDAIFRA